MTVFHIPYCTAEVADTALALLLNLVRSLNELEVALRQQTSRWQGLSLARIRRSNQLTLGVIGAGRISSAVLARAQAFGFRRVYYDPAVAACAGAERLDSLEALLGTAEIISLHVPLTPET